MAGYRFRLRFCKLGRHRFLTHHNLMSYIHRACRRAELPLRFREGPNPRPIIAFPVALPIGIESIDEIAEVELTTWVPPRQLQDNLNKQLSDDLKVLAVEAVYAGVSERVDYVEYEVLGAQVTDAVRKAIDALLSAKTFEITRKRGEGKSKQIDIREYIVELKVEGERIKMKVANEDDGTARPDEILKAIGITFDSSCVRVRKLATHIVKR